MKEQYIEKETFGNAWPFTVGNGVLINDKTAIIFKHKGKKYALNGVARAKGYNEIDPIWKDNKAIPGAKILLTKIIELGLSLSN